VQLSLIVIQLQRDAAGWTQPFGAAVRNAS
jgi:hypothetical protein